MISNKAINYILKREEVQNHFLLGFSLMEIFSFTIEIDRRREFSNISCPIPSDYNCETDCTLTYKYSQCVQVIVLYLAAPSVLALFCQLRESRVRGTTL